MIHRPVMVEEVLEVLDPRPGEVFLDLTVGTGGHAAALASRLGAEGFILGMDVDSKAVDVARGRLSAPGLPGAMLLHGNFVSCRQAMAEAGVAGADTVLLDLGVCSLQLDDADRGFSFAREGPLDMRMDPEAPGRTAADIVNRAPQKELERILREYGQERFARRIARMIVRERGKAPIRTTGRLAEIAVRACGGRRRFRIHPATRMFQALRIEVNAELDNLKEVLTILPEVLNEGGRIAAISFHSLEDRLVKEDFRSRAREGVYGVLTKKPVRPSDDEIRRNPRCRSAKLRAAQRSVR